MGFIMFLPIVAAMIGLIIMLFSFIGICLVIVGITGIVMNKIYTKQTNADRGVAKPFFNVGSIILGIAFMLLPLGYLLYGIITSLIQ